MQWHKETWQLNAKSDPGFHPGPEETMAIEKKIGTFDEIQMGSVD